MGFQGMGDSIVRVLGEPVTLKVGGAELPDPIRMVFRDAGESVSLAGAPINRPNPVFVVRADEWQASAAKNGDIIVRGGVEYTVVDIGPAEKSGLLEVQAREYPAHAGG